MILNQWRHERFCTLEGAHASIVKKCFYKVIKIFKNCADPSRKYILARIVTFLVIYYYFFIKIDKLSWIYIYIFYLLYLLLYIVDDENLAKWKFNIINFIILCIISLLSIRFRTIWHHISVIKEGFPIKSFI